ncbi:MAG: inositol monophosphatase [Clostridia bacterium]|nr:inositol monophosphatase [Clostridia bacterium]
MTERNEKIIEVIREAAKIMTSAPRGCPEELIHQKGGTFNFVTEYDVAVQRFLEAHFTEIIPDTKFLAEEEGEDGRNIGDGFTFIIDPIDGTSNFIHGLGDSGISVALLEDKETVFGAVYLPFSDEMFYAEKDGGAWLNGKPIHVSGLPLEKGLALFGTSPYMRDRLCDATLDLMRGLFMNSVDVRRFGAASADLCYVACGRAAAYCEMSLSPWDHAAGDIIVKEAGGYVMQFDGSDMVLERKCSTIAVNAAAKDKILEICGPIAEKYGITEGN